MLEVIANDLFGEMPDGVLVHRNGTIVYANARAAACLAADDPASLCGRCILELYPDDDYPTAVGRLQSFLFRKQPGPPCRARIQRLDGVVVTFELAAMLLPTAQGAFVVEVLRRVPGRKVRSSRPTP